MFMGCVTHFYRHLFGAQSTEYSLYSLSLIVTRRATKPTLDFGICLADSMHLRPINASGGPDMLSKCGQLELYSLYSAISCITMLLTQSIWRPSLGSNHPKHNSIRPFGGLCLFLGNTTPSIDFAACRK